MFQLSRFIFLLGMSSVLTGCADYLSSLKPSSELSSVSSLQSISATVPSPALIAGAFVEPTFNPELPKKYYTVGLGDTLFSISRKTTVPFKQLARWNKLLPPYALTLGQPLQLFETLPENDENTLSSETEKSIISIDKKNMLKLNLRWSLDGEVINEFSPPANKGIDIAGTAGQTVSATEAGIVVHSGSSLVGFGQMLVIQHDKAYLSAYTNLTQALVNEGQYVEQGQPIAKIGVIGDKMPFLHFEIRKNGKPINPLELLPKINQSNADSDEQR